MSFSTPLQRLLQEVRAGFSPASALSLVRDLVLVGDKYSA